MRPLLLVFVLIGFGCALAGCRSSGCGRVAGRAVVTPPQVVAGNAEGTQVFLDMRIFDVPAGQAPLLVVPTGDVAWTSALIVRPSLGVNRMWRDFLENPSVRVLAAPKLLILPDQEGTMFVGEEPPGHPEAWTGLRVVATAHLEPRGDLPIRLAVRVLRRSGEPDAGEQRAEILASWVSSGDTLILVSPTEHGVYDRRLAVLVTPKVIRAGM